MEVFNTIVRFFQDGGLFMYPIVTVLVIGLAIAFERIIFIRSTIVSNRQTWAELLPLVSDGKMDEARNISDASESAVGRIVSYGLNRLETSRDRQDVELAMEESLMEVMPQLEKRTPYLATFANIATLLGLLGTIIGLIQGFTAVASANPAEKADLLSASISVAMNTTAFGLMVAIPLLLIHALLQAKTTELVDSLEMTVVKFLNAFSVQK